MNSTVYQLNYLKFLNQLSCLGNLSKTNIPVVESEVLPDFLSSRIVSADFLTLNRK